jgi:hypothetical protein
MDEKPAVLLPFEGYSRHSRDFKNYVARSCTWWLPEMYKFWKLLQYFKGKCVKGLLSSTRFQMWFITTHFEANNGEHRILYHDELHDLSSSYNIVRIL